MYRSKTPGVTNLTTLIPIIKEQFASFAWSHEYGEGLYCDVSHYQIIALPIEPSSSTKNNLEVFRPQHEDVVAT